MLGTDLPMAAAALPSAQAEAARYALLRRLAPSMRHHLVVNLQPIGMIYEVMDRRLRQPQPDLAHVQDSASKINGFAKAALASCLDVVSWLAPDDTVTVPVDAAAREYRDLQSRSGDLRQHLLAEARQRNVAARQGTLEQLLAAYVASLSDGVPREGSIELWRFYVDRPWHGKGMAHLLMDGAKQRARRRGAVVRHPGAQRSGRGGLAAWALGVGHPDVLGAGAWGTPGQRRRVVAPAGEQEERTGRHEEQRRERQGQEGFHARID